MSRTPMKRLGEPSEIADTVAYLASNAASYITGKIVVVEVGRAQAIGRHAWTAMAGFDR